MRTTAEFLSCLFWQGNEIRWAYAGEWNNDHLKKFANERVCVYIYVENGISPRETHYWPLNARSKGSIDYVTNQL